MGLFSKIQMAQIMASAEKSKKLEEPPPKTKVNAKNLSAKINEISAKVVEHFKDSKAELITTPEALHDYISKMLKAGIGAIDTETTGLDKIKDTIVGVSLYYPGGVEVYIPIKHIVPIFDEPYKDQLTYEQVAAELQRLADSNIKLIFANADFDLAMIFKDLKVDLLPVFWYDVIIAWRCIKEDEKDNSLKGLYTKYPLKGKMDRMKFSDFFTADLFPYCNPQVAKLYAAADAKYTYELCMWQLPYLKKDNPKCQKHHFEAIADLVWGVEFPLTKICQLMHRRGIYLEKSVAAMLRTKYHGLLDAEYKKMYSLLDAVLNDPKYYSTSKRPFKAAKDFNPNSTPHVKWLCYDWLKLGNGKTNSTDKSVLSTYSHPLIAQILKCRSLVTLIGTFVDKLPDGTTADSRIHCTFKQIGAACIVGNSLILTNHGYCPIIDLFDGMENDGEYIPDSTSLYDKDLQKVTTSHRVVYHNTTTIRLKLRGGFSVEGTPNHPIICSTINRDDVYRTATNKRHFGDKTEFRRLDDVSVGDAVYIPIGYNIFPDEYVPTGFTLKDKYRDFQLDCKIPEYFTEDFAELLGMYFADGSIHDNCGHFSIRISNGDQDVIDRATDLVHSVFALPTKVNWGHTTWCTEFGNKRIECIRTVIGRGAKNKYVCKQIMQSPRSVVCAFIRGTTLDSSYDPDRQRLAINYFLKESADFVQQALANMGILSSLSIQKNADTIHYRVAVSGEFYKKFIDTVGVVQSKKRDIRDTYKKSGFYTKDNKYFAYVEEISYGNADVYDVTVPESHSFVANGMINHNTGRMSSASPNMQNIPSKSNDIRHMFRATPGYIMLSSDYS